MGGSTILPDLRRVTLEAIWERTQSAAPKDGEEREKGARLRASYNVQWEISGHYWTGADGEADREGECLDQDGSDSGLSLLTPVGLSVWVLGPRAHWESPGLVFRPCWAPQLLRGLVCEHRVGVGTCSTHSLWLVRPPVLLDSPTSKLRGTNGQLAPSQKSLHHGYQQVNSLHACLASLIKA